MELGVSGPLKSPPLPTHRVWGYLAKVGGGGGGGGGGAGAGVFGGLPPHS